MPQPLQVIPADFATATTHKVGNMGGLGIARILRVIVTVGNVRCFLVTSEKRAIKGIFGTNRQSSTTTDVETELEVRDRDRGET